ncbi:Ada metal-binding domain-containing protein [uncultured Succiniclasticum sp.]|uniref:Ada metal-binding domain-containing protein n=1 Tax=uncultured Succiniclasticum sp. TaxID=1500547 RepID=UPI0025E38E5D|nr:Ada metal-binding domain-containing protein [uncultured Succiniclasticum sp.]
MKRILALTAVLILICSTALAYVGNRNTRKFHHDSCSSVSQMKPSNRVYIETRDEAINSGYVPCQRCRP